MIKLGTIGTRVYSILHNTHSFSEPDTPSSLSGQQLHIKIELQSHTETLDWRHHTGHTLDLGMAPCTGTPAPALVGSPGTLPAPDNGEPLQKLLHAGKVF